MQNDVAPDFPPVTAILRAIVFCDSVSLDTVTQKATLVGLFDHVNALAYPPTFRGAVVVVLSDVTQPVDLRIEAVAYEDNPLGTRQMMGTATVVPPSIGNTATAVIGGMLALPVTRPGVADIFVYGNGERLGHRSLLVLPAAQQTQSQ